MVDRSLKTLRKRFPELGRVPVSLRLGSFRVEMIYWGWLGTKWWRNYLHTHSFFEICYAHDGAGTFELGSVRRSVRRGDLFVAKPNESHEIISDRKRPLGIYFWAFSLVQNGAVGTSSPAQASMDALLYAFAASDRVISRRDSMAVERTCELLLREITAPQPGYTQAVESLATKLILETARATVDATRAEKIDASPRSEAEAVTRTIQQYLRDNLGRPIGIRDLAAQVHLSQRHVNRIFKSVTGQTIGQALADLRIEAASQLLLQRGLPIKQIARAVGYPDARYFTTLFGHKTGLTPAAFRKNGGTRFLRRRRK